MIRFGLYDVVDKVPLELNLSSASVANGRLADYINSHNVAIFSYDTVTKKMLGEVGRSGVARESYKSRVPKRVLPKPAPLFVVERSLLVTTSHPENVVIDAVVDTLLDSATIPRKGWLQHFNQLFRGVAK